MAKNTGNGYRRGPIASRVQYREGDHYVKINTQTGERLGQREAPYKGVIERPRAYVDANFRSRGS